MALCAGVTGFRGCGFAGWDPLGRLGRPGPRMAPGSPTAIRAGASVIRLKVRDCGSAVLRIAALRSLVSLRSLQESPPPPGTRRHRQEDWEAWDTPRHPFVQFVDSPKKEDGKTQ